MQTLKDFKAKQCLLIIEQQRRTRQAHRDELDLAYAASRDPRPGTLDEQEMVYGYAAQAYAMVRARKVS